MPRPDFSALRPLVAPADLQRIESHILDTPLVAVSATEIRQRVKTGQSIAHMIPEHVAQYIRTHGLYKA